MPHTLVIVESPAKAKKIQGYLGSAYTVKASVGHIRDLPKKQAEIPKKYEQEAWARLGVNVDDGFSPIYVVSPEKRDTVKTLVDLAAKADTIILATDGDREGEAIAWHIAQELKLKGPLQRMVFNEITKDKILEAARNLRPLDTSLVDAQEARRILDRLYGYEVSPVLWRRVATGPD